VLLKLTVLSTNIDVISVHQGSQTSESGLKGADKPKKVRMAISLTTSCITASHQP
jgi:hypothetical protein